MKDKSTCSVLLNGILKENPVLVLILGTCPTLALTSSASNAIGMGLATTFVLLGSAEPDSIPAAFLRRTAAGGVFVTNVNDLSEYTVITTGMIIPG